MTVQPRQEHRDRRPERLHRRRGQQGAGQQAQAHRRRHRPGGLRIITTIDKTHPGRRRRRPSRRTAHGKAPDVQVGLTSIKPGDGAIVAMYGGADFQKEQFNSATDAIMQAGSTFKLVRAARRPVSRKPISTKTDVQRQQPAVLQGVRGHRGDETSGADEFQLRARASGRSTCARRPPTRSTPSSPSSTSRSGPKNTKDAAIAAGLPGEGRRARRHPTPTCSAPHRRTSSTWPTPTRPSPPRAAGHALPRRARSRADPATSTTRSSRQDRRPSARTSPPTPSTPCSRSSSGGTGAVRAGPRPADRRQDRHHRPTTRRPGSTGSPRSWPPRSACTATGKDGAAASMNDIGSASARSPAAPSRCRIWTDFMKAALKGTKVAGLPEARRPRRRRRHTPPPSTTTTQHDDHHDDHDSRDDHDDRPTPPTTTHDHADRDQHRSAAPDDHRRSGDHRRPRRTQ